MNEKSNLSKDKSDYKKMIPEYSDEEIMNILRKRKYYQDEALKIAMEEAVSRGLINSEQDLFSQEYDIKPLKFSLFPDIEDDVNRKRIRKSIIRALIITGIIPTVWGFLKINMGKISEGGILLISGILWIASSARLNQVINRKILAFHCLLLFVSVFYIIKLLLGLKLPSFMDIFIPAVLYLLIIYGLIFIWRLRS